jgi:hypothetical protein
MLPPSPRVCTVRYPAPYLFITGVQISAALSRQNTAATWVCQGNKPVSNLSEPPFSYPTPLRNNTSDYLIVGTRFQQRFYKMRLAARFWKMSCEAHGSGTAQPSSESAMSSKSSSQSVYSLPLPIGLLLYKEYSVYNTTLITTVSAISGDINATKQFLFRLFIQRCGVSYLPTLSDV